MADSMTPEQRKRLDQWHVGELDTEIDELRRGREGEGVANAIDAIDHAEARNLAPLEMTMAADAAQARHAGETEAAWMLSKQHLTGHPALSGVGSAKATNRLEQAIANIKLAGLYPW